MSKRFFLGIALLSQCASAFFPAGITQTPTYWNPLIGSEPALGLRSPTPSSFSTKPFSVDDRSGLTSNGLRQHQKIRASHSSREDTLTRSPAVKHLDSKVLKKQTLDEPIESRKAPPPLPSAISRAKMEAIPWIVSGLIGLLLSETSGSPLPGGFVFLVEFLFLLYNSQQATEFNRPTVAEPVSRDILELWELTISTPNQGPEDFLSDWFYGASIETIRKEDVQDFVAWATFSSTFEKLQRSSKMEVGRILSLFEEKIDREFQPRQEGEKPARVMRFSMEPMEYVHKPAMYYLVTKFGLDSVAYYQLVKRDFKRYTAGVFSYWAYVPSSEEGRKKLPVVFFHGIGIGLLMYLGLIDKVLEEDRPVICVELPFVASKVDSKVPSIDEQVESVKTILNRWDIDKALFMGHSYGSLILSWMVHHAPSRVAGITFIDPVVLMLNRIDILFNFLYKNEGESKFFDIVGSELYTNHALRRHFWWYRNILFAQDVHAAQVPSLVCLSERDEIVPSQAVVEHIADHAAQVGEEESMLECYVMEEAAHGQMLFDDELATELMGRVSTFWGNLDAEYAKELRPMRQQRQRDMSTPAWLLTQGRWRLRQLDRAATQFPKLKEVGAAASATMMIMTFGWQFLLF